MRGVNIVAATMQTPADPIALAAADARRFLRRAQHVDDPLPTVADALRHLGYVQIDPINVCGRMHDLILRLRVAGYREGDLMAHLYPGAAGDGRPRDVFEHHLPLTKSAHILVAFSVDAWPHLVGVMRTRERHTSLWSGQLKGPERAMATRVLEEIRVRGPLSSDQIDDRRPGRTYWGHGTLAKVTMQKLYFHGQLLIAGREQIRRKYDLPERVVPPEVLRRAAASPAETTRWLAELKVRQRRLSTLSRLEQAAAADFLQPIKIKDADAPLLYCLPSDLPLLDSAAAAQPARRSQAKEGRFAHPLLLAPLDPLIYDRKVTRAIWDFDYTWEAYVPAAKRLRGHYAMPLLCGLEMAGHVDPKADRRGGRLRVVSRRARRGFSAAPAVKELASFLGLRT